LVRYVILKFEAA